MNSNPTDSDRDARIEDVRWMAETGESLIGAARRLGITESALDLWLRRQGFRDLAVDLRSRNPRDPNAIANRTAVCTHPSKARYRAAQRAVA